MQLLIYTLLDEFGLVRYVGRTVGPLSSRLYAHLQEAKDENSRTYKSRWIRSMLSRGQSPTIFLIETTEDGDREKYWIAFFKRNGVPLTNVTEGGEGTVGYRHTEAAKLVMSEKKRGMTWPAEVVERRSQSQRGLKRKQETKDRISQYQKGRPSTGAAAKGHPKSNGPALSVTWTKKWSDPSFSEVARPKVAAVGRANAGRHHTEDAKGRISETLTGRVLTEEHRANQSKSAQKRERNSKGQFIKGDAPCVTL